MAVALKWVFIFLLLEWLAAPVVNGLTDGDGAVLLLVRLGIFAAFVIGVLAVIASRLSHRNES